MSMWNDIQLLLGLKQPPSESLPKRPPRKVLLVEDDISLAKALNDALSNAGFEVYHAGNGQKGLEMAKNVEPNIILLDLMMPVMNGKVMLRKLREFPEFKFLPVIVLTNAGQVDNIKETVDYDDAVEFLIKSNVSLDEIVEKVRRTH